MGRRTTISWCHHTFNPWWGCWKISPGCKHCYAAAFDHRLRGGHWERGGPRRFFGEEHWQQPLRWQAAARAGERARVFCASMADIFEQHPDPVINAQMDAARDRVWNLLDETPDLDWLFLTKRIEEVATTIPWLDDDEPPPNAWMGTTVEDDEYARLRLPELQRLRDHAAKLFVSYEPAIGRVRWTPSMLRGIDLVIFGDESGRTRRPAELDWARATRDACADAGVAFHFKQWCGELVDGVEGERAKGRIHLPILDGVQHAEMPG
jgi:protein gp37